MRDALLAITAAKSGDWRGRMVDLREMVNDIAFRTVGPTNYIYDLARISKVINMPMRGFIPTQMTINPCCDAARTVGAATIDIQTGG